MCRIQGMIPALTFLTMTCLLAAAPASAAHVFQPLGSPSADCDQPAIACSPTGMTMVAWVEEGEGMDHIDIVWTQLIASYPHPEELPNEPVSHGPGTDPVLCWSRNGFTLAMISGGAVVTYRPDLGGIWDPEEFDVLVPYPDAFGIDTIDLWGCAAGAADPDVFLALGGTLHLPEVDRKVMFASRGDLGWSGFELVADGLDSPGLPQVSWSPGGAGPWPCVYYLDSWGVGEQSLVFTTRELGVGWDAPSPVPGAGGIVPGPIAGPFDVDRRSVDTIAVLGNGPQPTCPCGSIHCITRDDVDGWDDPVDLTVDHPTHYDWPMSPDVAVDSDERVHAFWFQEGSAEMMEPRLRTLEYHVREGGGWSEAGGFLDGQEGPELGSRVAMALTGYDDPVLTWTRKDTVAGEPLPRTVWIARPEFPSNAGDDRVPSPMVLTAHPNPFNPAVTLTCVLPRETRVVLTIHDVTGRLVRRLIDGVRPAGESRVRWDGRDDAGRAATSGMYLGRIAADGAVRNVKLMLVR